MNETTQAISSDDTPRRRHPGLDRLAWYPLAKPLVRSGPLVVIDVFA
jgi:hypothetical protein